MSPLRGGFLSRGARTRPGDFRDASSRSTQSESTRAGGGFPARAPTSPIHSLFCFRSGHRNRNDGYTFPFPPQSHKINYLVQLQLRVSVWQQDREATGRPNWTGNILFPHVNAVDLRSEHAGLPTGRHDGSLARCVSESNTVVFSLRLLTRYGIYFHFCLDLFLCQHADSQKANRPRLTWPLLLNRTLVPNKPVANIYQMSDLIWREHAVSKELFLLVSSKYFKCVVVGYVRRK